jgi:hypothetical protein
MLGIEPKAFHMRKGRSISELHPHLSNVNVNTTLSAALFSEYLQEKHYATSRGLEFPCASFNLVLLAFCLQEGGVDIDLKDGDEATPLHFAASRGHADCVSFFFWVS